MKLYALCTPSHKELKNEWFLPSIKDDFDLIFEEHDQLTKSGSYKQSGWIETMCRKVELIIRAINENPDTVFIHSDVDLQFFKPVKETIVRLMKGKDMVIQQESPGVTVCPGFFAACGNERNLNLWQNILDSLRKQRAKHDQDFLNEELLIKLALPGGLLKHYVRRPSWLPNRNGIKWAHLPGSFYSSGISKARIWSPGAELTIPHDIMLHHANWTIGIENKIAMLKYVKEIVENR